ncbi:MAG: two-component system response regulator [Spirochaetes bacterium GWB1_59_5]|nr:MAG: two-component system response regulator [Spirochaetes bacterium GWB1_59_5]
MDEHKLVDILLVEDNPNDAELAMRALKKNNLVNNLVLVGDGETALDFMFCRGKYQNRDHLDKPRLILLDLKLPKVDGLEVLKTLKTHPDTKITPIVVLTTSREESDVLRSYDLGANSYIVKPVDFDKFTQSVRELGLYWLLLNERP